MFEGAVKQCKSLPSFAGTDDYQGTVTLDGDVKDARFVQVFRRVGQEKLASFATEDFLVLDLIRRESGSQTV